MLGIFVMLMGGGTTRADGPKAYAELCIECRVQEEGGRSKFVSHRIKLGPDELSSLAFDLEAVGDAKVRVSVSRQGDEHLGFDSVEVVSKPGGEEESRFTVRGQGDKPLQVTSDKITVCYDKPFRWWVLMTAKVGEDHKFLARVRARDREKEFQAKRFTARFEEHKDQVSARVSDVVEKP